MTAETRLNSHQLREFMNNTTNIIRKDGKVVGFKPTVILNGYGEPVSLDLFLKIVKSPERVVINPPFSHEEFQKTNEERAALKRAKAAWKRNMKALFGNAPDWQQIARKNSIHNVPDNPSMVRNLITNN